MRTSLALLVTLLTAAVGAADAPRFNVVFCFADDWGRYASAYAKHEPRPTANSVVKTPNIDAVAARGTLFRNAFVCAPSCTPCRSSLVTGRYFFTTGRASILQGAVWDGSLPAFPLLLQEAGYTIGKTAKVWSPGTPADAPIGAQKHAFQKAGMKFNNFSENVTAAVEKGAPLAMARDAMLAEVRGNFDAFLKSREAGKPFFYWFGPTTTHRTWIKGSGKALWGIDPDSLKGKMPGQLPDVPAVREDFADYLGEVQAFDAYVGVLMKQIDDAGERDRTLVVISGDHGGPGFPGGKCNLYDFGVGVSLVTAWPGQKAGRVVDDFVNLMDLAPTFLEVGGVKPPDGTQGKSLVNVLKSDKSGQVDPSRTFVVVGRERHVAAARAGNLPYPHRALRTADFLYVRNFAPDRAPMGDTKGALAADAKALETDTHVGFEDLDAGPTKAWLVLNRDTPTGKVAFNHAFDKRPAEELYDCRADPDQMKNVAGDAKYATSKAEMAARLMKLLKDNGDPRAIDAECRYDRPPFTDPVGK